MTLRGTWIPACPCRFQGNSDVTAQTHGPPSCPPPVTLHLILISRGLGLPRRSQLGPTPPPRTGLESLTLALRPAPLERCQRLAPIKCTEAPLEFPMPWAPPFDMPGGHLTTQKVLPIPGGLDGPDSEIWSLENSKA